MSHIERYTYAKYIVIIKTGSNKTYVWSISQLLHVVIWIIKSKIFTWSFVPLAILFKLTSKKKYTFIPNN